MDKKILIVLDIHGVLCKKNGHYYPNLIEFLDFCYNNYNVAFYSSMLEKNINKFLNKILNEKQLKETIFIYTRDKCSIDPNGKNTWDTIKNIGIIKNNYPMYDKIILCDDNYDKVRYNDSDDYILVNSTDDYHLKKLKLDIINKIND